MVRFTRALAAASVILAACTSTVLETEGGDAGGVPGDDAATRPDTSRPSVDGGADPDASVAEDGGHDAHAPSDGGQDAKPLVDCGTVSPQVFTSALGPFCPFQAGNVFNNCAVGEHCCEYAEEAGVPSTCSAGPTACGVEIATGFDWRCDETNDCPGGQVCCFAGAITPHLQCAGQYSAPAGTHSTACRIATCAAGETRTCGTQADCPAGTTCTAMRLRGKHFGFCKP